MPKTFDDVTLILPLVLLLHETGLTIPESAILQQTAVEVVAEALPVQPFTLVTVTVNVPDVLTEIVCVVEPVDQMYPANNPASNTVEPPEQKDKDPEITGVGSVLTVVVTRVLPVQPLPFVTVTVNVPAVFTEMVWVLAPVDQL